MSGCLGIICQYNILHSRFLKRFCNGLLCFVGSRFIQRVINESMYYWIVIQKFWEQWWIGMVLIFVKANKHLKNKRLVCFISTGCKSVKTIYRNTFKHSYRIIECIALTYLMPTHNFIRFFMNTYNFFVEGSEFFFFKFTLLAM